MKIGILGSGEVGRTLAAGLAARGHEVFLGTRQPSAGRIADWQRNAGKGVRVGTFGETASAGELLILAINWGGMQNALGLAGAGSFKGKIVIDATNPLDFNDIRSPRLAITDGTSAGEQIQRWLPESMVVKAFNHIGALHMVNPDFPGGPPDMLICGNSRDAKNRVRLLAESLGWPVSDVGPIEMSRHLESLALLWIVHSISTGDREHAFKILEK
jgi:8-hydroxy-5-deazaflavin:NADPH oxidoreductase